MNKTVKLPSADLSYDNLKTISNKQMLIDNVINVLQTMLKQKFTDAMGFQDTLLGQSWSLLGQIFTNTKSSFQQYIKAV